MTPDVASSPRWNRLRIAPLSDITNSSVGLGNQAAAYLSSKVSVVFGAVFVWIEGGCIFGRGMYFWANWFSLLWVGRGVSGARPSLRESGCQELHGWVMPVLRVYRHELLTNIL